MAQLHWRLTNKKQKKKTEKSGQVLRDGLENLSQCHRETMLYPRPLSLVDGENNGFVTLNERGCFSCVWEFTIDQRKTALLFSVVQQLEQEISKGNEKAKFAALATKPQPKLLQSDTFFLFQVKTVMSLLSEETLQRGAEVTKDALDQIAGKKTVVDQQRMYEEKQRNRKWR